MKELLESCGFAAHEIPLQLPRLRRVCEKFGIGDEDIRISKSRLAKYYAMELEGVRQAIRLCMLEFLDSILAREEGKRIVLSGFMAPGFDVVGSAAMAQSDEVYSSHQSWALMFIMGCVFGKTAFILEAAEKRWLKAGMVAHCGNVKMLLGSVALELIPKPDLMVTSGFLCETAPKTLDLMREVYDMPVACYDTCFDRHTQDYTGETRRTMEMAAKSLRAVVAGIERIVGFGIADDMLSAVLQAKGKLNRAMGKVSSLITGSDPMPLSATHAALWMCLNSLTLNEERLDEAAAALDVLHNELQERVGRGVGPLEKGAPRILAMLPGQHADPRFEHLVEEVGIAIVGVDPDLAVPFEEKSRDPYFMLCMGLSHSLITSLALRIPLIIEACKQLKVDGLLDRYHVGCRSVVGDALIIEGAVKKEVGIPVMLLEWENFDPRVFDYEDYKKRLEVFKAMMMQ